MLNNELEWIGKEGSMLIEGNHLGIWCRECEGSMKILSQDDIDMRSGQNRPEILPCDLT
jgi:hypothetical protein